MFRLIKKRKEEKLTRLILAIQEDYRQSHLQEKRQLENRIRMIEEEIKELRTAVNLGKMSGQMSQQALMEEWMYGEQR